MALRSRPILRMARTFFVLGALAMPTRAFAQVHWDAAAEVGGTKRFLASRPPGSGDAGFGPQGQLAAHIALLPVVRAGLYVGHDISPLAGDAAARDITWFGGRLKGTPPFALGDMRFFVFAGFGYSIVYARSYSTALAIPNGLGGTTKTNVLVGGAGGGFFEVPFGIGATYKLRKPWALTAELGARVGFGHSGSAYEVPGPQVSIPGKPDDNVLPSGVDRFALGLTVGLLLDL